MSEENLLNQGAGPPPEPDTGTGDNGAPAVNPDTGQPGGQGSEGQPEPEPDDHKEVFGKDAPPKEGEPQERPEWLPEQFWDEEKGEPRQEAMMKSYKEMKTLLDQKGYQPPSEYKLELPEGLDELDSADEEFFREAGFTNDQAQQAVDFLYENIVPQMRDLMVSAEAADLEAEWGMKKDSDAFKTRMGELRKWAYEAYPKEMVDHLARNSAGVKQLWSAMQAGHAGNVQSPGAGTKRTKAELESAMQSDKYWEDPHYAAKIEQEFRELFDK